MYSYEERSKLARKVLLDGVFVNYPTWFDEIDVTPGEISEFSGMKAYMLLTQDNAKRPKFCTQVSRINIIIDKGELVVEALMLEESEVDSLSNTLEVVTDVLNYNLILKDYSMFDNDEINASTAVKSMVKNLNLERRVLVPGMSLRQEVLDYVNDYPEVLGYIGNIRASMQYYRDITTMTDFDEIRVKDNFFLDSHPGLRDFTNNFVIGRFSSDLIHTITEFLDIRQCLLSYRVRVVVVKGRKLKPYLVDMLVRNGFYVVDSRFPYLRLSDEHVKKKIFGAFSEVDPWVDHAIYISDNPHNKDVLDVVELMDHVDEAAICTFVRVRLFKTIGEIGEYGLLPSSCPGQGQVICIYPPTHTYDKLVLAQRARNFMMQRYEYLNTDIIWAKIDVFADVCGYGNKYILPQISLYFGQHYGTYENKDDFFTGKIKRVIDEKFMFEMLMRKLSRESTQERYVLRIIQSDYIRFKDSWLRLWRDNNYQLGYLVDKIKAQGADYYQLVMKCQALVINKMNNFSLEEMRKAGLLLFDDSG